MYVWTFNQKMDPEHIHFCCVSIIYIRYNSESNNLEINQHLLAAASQEY